MPPSLPALNVLVAPKSLPTPGAGKSASALAPAHAAVEEGAPSFKQSLQKLTPTTKGAASGAEKNAHNAKGDAAIEHEYASMGIDDVGAAISTPLEFMRFLSVRSPMASGLGEGNAVTDAQGLSYLARLAGEALAASPSNHRVTTTDAIGDPAAPLLPITATDESLGAPVGMFSAALLPGMASEPAALNPFGQYAAKSPLSEHIDLNAKGQASGKNLPPWLAASTEPSVALHAPTATSPTSGASLDASALPAGALPTVGLDSQLRQNGSLDFKALMNAAALDSKVSSKPSAEQAATTVKETDNLAQTLSAPSSMGAPGNALHFEGRTAIPMTIAFGHAQWSNNLAERAVWMAGQTIHSAEIQLDPPELGPLQIKIQVNQDQATVSFVSANPQVREAVEQSMGRLRELFQEQGLELVDSGVSDHQPKQEQGQGEPGEQGMSSASSDGGDPLVSPDLHTLVAPAPWGVDYYV